MNESIENKIFRIEATILNEIILSTWMEGNWKLGIGH